MRSTPQRIVHEPRRCEQAGCRSATREGKAYCSDHIDNEARVRWLHAALDRRTAEVIELATKPTEARDDSPILRDVLTLFWEHGPGITLSKLAVLLDAELSPLEDKQFSAVRRSGKRLAPAETDEQADADEVARAHIRSLKHRVAKKYMNAIFRRGIAHWERTPRGEEQLVLAPLGAKQTAVAS